MIAACRTALSWMTILPVGPAAGPDGRATVPDARLAGRAMSALPLVGLVCGLVAAGVAHGLHALGAGALLSGVVGVAAVVTLTRGMHVDALADTADALGSYAGPERAREIMRSGSVGPMGAAVLVLVLLAEVAALGALVEAGAWVAPVAAFVLARCLPIVQLRRGVPAASETGFGALVAGSQSSAAVAGAGLLAALAGAGLAVGAGAAVSGTGILSWWTPVLGAAAGLVAYAAAAGFARHVTRRLGGISGDVLGASLEAGTAVGLVVAVLLV